MITQLPMSLIPDKLPVPERRRITSVKETAPVTEALIFPTVPEKTDGDAIEITRDAVPEPATTEEGPDDVLVIEATTQSDMEQRMTLRQLRDMCSEMNLPTTGKKAELVSRIIEERERSKGG